MNYIKEINSFYDWLETNPLTDSSIVLWHALMHINNKCGWKQEFAVAISTLELKTGLSKSSILRSRNALAQLGRINFKSRNGQQSAVYSMIAFHSETQSGTQSGAQSGAQSGTQSGAQLVPITKLNETKRNNSSPGEPEAKKNQADRYIKKNEYWKEFVKTFDDWYQENLKTPYNYLGKDWSSMDKIYKFLKKRSETKKVEWTEQYMTQAFQYFLNQAWTKDDWLRKNFSLSNILSQFNQIVNSNALNNGKNGAEAGAKTGALGHKSGGFAILGQALQGSSG